MTVRVHLASAGEGSSDVSPSYRICTGSIINGIRNIKFNEGASVPPPPPIKVSVILLVPYLIYTSTKYDVFHSRWCHVLQNVILMYM